MNLRVFYLTRRGLSDGYSFTKEMHHAPSPCRHELGAWYKQAEGFA